MGYCSRREREMHMTIRERYEAEKRTRNREWRVGDKRGKQSANKREKR